MNVKIGPASITGWLLAAGAWIGFAGTAIAGTEAQLHGPGKWLAITGLVSLLATNAGRQLQAATGGGTADPSLTAPPESGVTPDSQL